MTAFYLYLDWFKPVNDEFGHDVGDELLAAVARRRRRAVCGRRPIDDRRRRASAGGFPEDAPTAEQLLSTADAAMFHRKRERDRRVAVGRR